MPSRENEYRKSFWNRLASKPSENLAPESQVIIDKCHEVFPTDCTALDYGCGTGRLTVELGKACSAITGVDPSERSIELAKEWNHTHGYDHVMFQTTPPGRLPNNMQNLDAITTFNVLNYVPDLAQPLMAFHQALRPGGVFVSSTACFGQKASFIRALIFTVSKIGLMPKTHFFTQKGFQNQIEKAGFHIEKSEFISNIPELFIVARKK